MRIDLLDALLDGSPAEPTPAPATAVTAEAEPAPEAEPAAVEETTVALAEAPAEPAAEPLPTFAVDIPPEAEYSAGGTRHRLIFEGNCTHCAHCGQPLTDSVSQERGIGPVCSKRGYHDEVAVDDDTDALLALAPYPQLVDYLVRKYKAVGGNRALVNGLVRTASLNRRTPVHSACTDAIDALGFKRLASTLREALAVVALYDDADMPDSYGLWVKKSDFDWDFYNAVKKLDGFTQLGRKSKFGPKRNYVAKTERLQLATLLIKYYEGLCLTIEKNGEKVTHKITQEWFKSAGGASA